MRKNTEKYLRMGLVILFIFWASFVSAPVFVSAAVVATNTYDVSGTTLKEVWDSITENSPNSGGWAGESSCVVDAPWIESAQKVVPSMDHSCPGGFRYTVSITGTITWSIETTITLPDGYNSACPEVQAEWNRFLAALTTHEEEHDEVAEAALTNAAPLTTITGTGSDCNQSTAIANAEADLEAKYDEEYQRVLDAVKAASDKYDAPYDPDTNPKGTNHGERQGAVLNCSIGCPEVPDEEIEKEPDSLQNSSGMGKNVPSQNFAIWAPPNMTLTYLISDDADWLECNPSSGTSIGEHDLITVNYQTSSLVAGDYSATITITGQLISNPPASPPAGGLFTKSASATLPVTLTITEPAVGGIVELPGVEEPGAAIPDLSDHNYGALAGIIVGAIVGVIMLISAVWYIRRRRTKAI